jgi:hypothetical protein
MPCGQKLIKQAREVMISSISFESIGTGFLFNEMESSSIGVVPKYFWQLADDSVATVEDCTWAIEWRALRKAHNTRTRGRM